MCGKKIKYPIHKMGKYSGFYEYEDGSIKIAPRHYQKMDNVLIQEAAVDAILKSLTEQCQKLMVPLIEERHRFWAGIVEDYSLDPSRYEHTYDPITHILTKKLKEAPECSGQD